jgi:hypothetical protein
LKLLSLKQLKQLKPNLKESEVDYQGVLQDTVAPQAPIVVHHHQVAADQVEATGSHTAIEKQRRLSFKQTCEPDANKCLQHPI